MSAAIVRADSVENNLRRIGAWPTLERIAKGYMVLQSIVIGKGRLPNIVRARDRLLFVLHGTTGMSLNELGQIMDMDHTSVMTALAREEKRARERCGI